MGRNEEGKFNVAVGAMIEHTKSRKILLIKRSSKVDYEPNILENIKVFLQETGQ